MSPLLTHRDPLVVGYHRVVEDFEHESRAMMPSMLVSRSMLERQLDCLGRHYDFVSVEDFDPARTASRRPLAAVTFDDGYRDVYYEAFPLLKRKGIPAAIFVVSDLVGTTRLLLNDRVYWLLHRLVPTWSSPAAEIAVRLTRAGVALPQAQRISALSETPAGLTRALLTELAYVRLRRVCDQLERDAGQPPALPDGCQPVTWDMLREMRAAGMTIGSHTQRHIRLTNESRDLQRQEVTASRLHLERELGGPVRHFAYPDGAFNSAAVRLIAGAGYKAAYTICRHRDPYHSRLTIPRLMLWEHSSIDPSGRLSASILRMQTRGMWSGAPACSYVVHA
jgi:peptidoglycan/xylan/chitin deacetylase (PgdA/CDA1 family)